MQHFLHQLISSPAVVLFAIWVFFLFSLLWGGYPGVRTGIAARAYGSIVPFLFFLIVTVVAFIAWLFAVFT